MFTLDTSPTHTLNGVQVQTGMVLNWIAGTAGTQPVSFGGTVYQPLPIAAQDWEWSGQGAIPQPKLSVSNVGGVVAGLVIAFDDLIGAKVTRIRTFARYLDGQPQQNSSIMFEPDIFYINRKSLHDKTQIQFELATAFDEMARTIPARKILRNICGHTYRQYVNGGFILGTCPYAGSAMFQADDTPTNDATKDVCSLHLHGCVVRFGETANLPFDGFPGAGDTGNIA